MLGQIYIDDEMHIQMDKTKWTGDFSSVENKIMESTEFFLKGPHTIIIYGAHMYS